jgi:hypothetical protein
MNMNHRPRKFPSVAALFFYASATATGKVDPGYENGGGNRHPGSGSVACFMGTKSP